MNVYDKKNLWASLGLEEEQPQGPWAPELPPNIKIDDSTNTRMIPKSVSVSVKRPMGYARPAQEGETVEDWFRQYGEASERAAAQQHAGVDQLEANMAKLKETAMPESTLGRLSNVNIAPMLAQLDSMNGAKSAQAYQQPETMTERQKMVMQLEDAIQKRRGEVTKSEAEMLKDKISLFLKGQDDPMKDLMGMTRIQYMQDMGALARDRIGRAEDDKIERDVQKLAEKVGNPQELANSIKALEGSLGFKLDEFDESTGTLKGKKVNLPGSTVPGLGRVTFYDSNARNLQSKFARIFNVELKDRSGAAVTNPEMDRMKEEFNSGRFNTEQELIAAVKAYKSAANQEFENREAAFRPQVKERYRSRGGQLTEDFKGGAGDAAKLKRLQELKQKYGR